ncbi:MAG: DUF2336 domain-containing protein [Alphaproteobacteria bacterium]|jgi:uncharacterized protein (DUF2336 family)
MIDYTKKPANQNLKESLVKISDLYHKSPTLENKIILCKNICDLMNYDAYEGSQANIVFDILQILANDTQLIIRKTISEELKENENLPHHIALKLAYDVPEVANPILQFSNILSDEDIIQLIDSIIETTSLRSISNRKKVSDKVSTKLIETHNEDVVIDLVANQNAFISNDNYNKIITDFRNSSPILETLVKQRNLEPSIAEKLLNFVSDELKNVIKKQYNLTNVSFDSNESVSSAVDESREKLTLDLIDNSEDKEKIIHLVDHLFEADRLKFSIMIKALCRGDMFFFKYALCKITNQQLKVVDEAIKSQDRVPFIKILENIAWPKDFRNATILLLRQMALNDSSKFENKSRFLRYLVDVNIRNGNYKTVQGMEYFVKLMSEYIKNGPEKIV